MNHTIKMDDSVPVCYYFVPMKTYTVPIKRTLQLLFAVLIVNLFLACQPQVAVEDHVMGKGILKVGFDIDDTIVFSRDNFLIAPHLSDDPDHVDYNWINSHDYQYSKIIKPTAELVWFLKSLGHEVYFITARPGVNGDSLAIFLSDELGFQVKKDEQLFFSPKEYDPESGHKYTTKHRVISKLGLHIYVGDSDNDMIAASIAGVRAVRIVRDQSSIDEYSRNYFGDTKQGNTKSAPFSNREYQKFLRGGVGPFGETIYPIFEAQAPVTE